LRAARHQRQITRSAEVSTSLAGQLDAERPADRNTSPAAQRIDLRGPTLIVS
jgi:hypothetical protein